MHFPSPQQHPPPTPAPRFVPSSPSNPRALRIQIFVKPRSPPDLTNNEPPDNANLPTTSPPRNAYGKEDLADCLEQQIYLTGLCDEMAFVGILMSDGKRRPETRMRPVLGHLELATQARSTPVIVPGISMSLRMAANSSALSSSSASPPRSRPRAS